MPLLPHVPIVQMFFKTGETGWTESHLYLATGNPTLYAVQQFATELAKLRVQMLAWGIVLYRIRISYLDVWRDSVYATVPSVSKNTTTTNEGVPLGVNYYLGLGNKYPPGDPWDVAAFRLESGVNHRGEEDISGYPDGMLSQDLTFPFTDPNYANYSNATSNYFNALCNSTGQGIVSAGGAILNPSVGGPWGTLVRVKAADALAGAVFPAPYNAAPTPIGVTGVGYVAPAAGPPVFSGGWIFTLAGPPTGIVVGSTVRTLGIQQNPTIPKQRVNGTWNVFSVGANSITVNYAGAAAGVQAVGTNGTVQLIIMAAFPYNNWLFDGTTHRKRGVPSDRPHGRRKRSVPQAAV